MSRDNQYSDYSKPFTNLNEFLPEVYRSSVNTTVFDTSMNRHLTKDDTTRIAGYIGLKNTGTLVDRQIKEATPHRQAYQLAPTMVSKVGTVEEALSFKGFESQLRLMGVDFDRLPLWANTLRFNWVPPVNLDMVVNYQDYFWNPTNPQQPAEYFVIENRCNKARSKVRAYEELLQQRGTTFSVASVDYKNNAMLLNGLYSDLFVPGFIFLTKSAEPNLNDKFWTVSSSVFNLETNQTQLNLIEPISTVADTPPSAVNIGQWWFDTSTNLLKTWNGSAWVIAPVQQPIVTISLAELATIYQTDANCACNRDYGWDIAPWDDNQLLPSSIQIWSEPVLAAISFATEAEWITANGVPNQSDNAQYKIWNDTTNNILKEYDFDASAWENVAGNFSAIAALATGNARWDQTVGCDIQDENPWSSDNQWIHKSEVQYYPNARRAQVPILEYSSTAELNKWSRNDYAWYYRPSLDAPFELVDVDPSRFELEPIKGYAVTNIMGSWYVYLANNDSTVNRNIDYTDSFPEGSQIRFADDGVLSEVYRVVDSEYREITASDPMSATIGVNQMATILRLDGTVFTSPLIGGGSTDPMHTRIVPVRTTFGDTWLGYHIHWMLNVLDTVTTPNATVPSELYKNRDALAVIAATATPANLPYYDTVTIGRTFEEFTVLTSGLVTVNLESALTYGSAFDVYATPGSNEIRVYFDGVRQYGNYTETTAVASPDYTVVGTSSYTTMDIPYVDALVFADEIPPFTVVRIEVGPAAFADMGWYAVPVRTIADETEFTNAVNAGTQPVYMSLTQYELLEQVKTDANQYPLFNVYDVVTSEVVKASPIFAYREDSSMPVNPDTNRRIVTSVDGREYEFEQYLLDRDDNILYGYRNVDSTPRYWYSDILKEVQYWDGTGWTNKIPVVTSTGLLIRVAEIAAMDPVDVYTTPGDLWYNTTLGKLYHRVGTTWVEEPNLINNGTDPQMRTIWRHGTTDYVPQYVDKDRQPIVVGSSAGDWELVSQWMNNPEHQNKQVVSYTQLLTHFRTIIEAQPQIPGLLGGGIYSLSQDEYDYGLGGTIKEHNDSFDTLISAVNVTNATPISVVEFAAQQYATALMNVREIFNRLVPTFASQFSRSALADLATYVADSVIDAYEQNDFAQQVFGDTSAYDATTGKGIKNWPATTPMFGIQKLYAPFLNFSRSGYNLFHHDGHRSTISYTPGEQDRLARAIVATPDPRGGPLGLMKATAPPATYAGFSSAYGVPLRVGAFWYRVGGGARRLYKMSAYDVTTLAPSFYDSTGAEIPDGTRYYNLTTSSVWTKQGLSWVQTSAPGAGDISSLWDIVDFAELLASVYLEVETRLHDVTPVFSELVFDYSTLQAEPLVYADLHEDRFMQYVALHDIETPFMNTQYNATNAFTWNYASSLINTPPRNGSLPEPAASWQALYTNCYGTPYPHLEPWVLQGFADKPTWWDGMYLNTVGSRRWVYNSTTDVGMWANIRDGVIPVGGTNPDGTPGTGAAGAAPTYVYFSVNTSNVTIAGGYAPDDLLPPYYDNTAVITDPMLRSIYTMYSVEVTAPDADYVFGQGSPYEWEWTVSLQSRYDDAIIAFQMQPARMLHYMFGTKYTIVDSLQVETTFHQVYSHEDALFHGDIYNTDELYTARGLNQWYVNFNRYSGYDTNGEFRELWVGWNPHLTYQFGGIVDTSTIDISSKYFDVIEQDYHVLLANDGVVADLWSDAFEVSLLNIPPAIIQYNNESQWKMELDTLSPMARSISYYGVKQYPFTVDVSTNECTMFRYSMLSVDISASRIVVPGDQTGAFIAGETMAITGSPANNGFYTVQSAYFDSTNNNTRIVVEETLSSSSNVGVIEVGTKVVTWNTGDPVVVSTTKFLPAPLYTNTVYYVIKTGAQRFKLAETPDEATQGIAIDLTTTGVGNLYVSQVMTSFNVYGGAGNTAELWYHFVIDKNDIRTFTPPMIVNGMQNFINIIDGYAAFQADSGLLLGTADSNDFDPLTGRLSTWELETERFMDWAFGMRNANMRIANVYPVRLDSSLATFDVTTNSFTAANVAWSAGQTVRFISGTLPSPLIQGVEYYLIATATEGRFQLGLETSPMTPIVLTTPASGAITVTTDRLQFTQMTPVWKNGTVVLMNSSIALPDPIIEGVPYYVVVTGTEGFIRLSTSALAIDDTSLIRFDSVGAGQLSLSREVIQSVHPQFEMNPTRNNVWIDTPVGILSDVIAGPYTDIRVQQTIFDQYGRSMGPDKITVYRQDKRAHVSVVPALPNDMDPTYTDDPYNYIHIGGGHFFTEGYEHYLIFNDYTIGGALVYNPFLGLSTSRFDVDYFEKEDYTLRPTLGGFYLLDGKFYRNIEGSTEDMRNYYDTFALSETTEVARRSRNLLGYDGNMPFLDWLNVNEKSQFLFYKGMIQSKGSINSVTAYINSRRFVDAKIDEFWAYKIAEFGDARPRYYPRVKLRATDSEFGDVRLKFLSETEDPNSQANIDAVENGFQLISFADETRWDQFPQQRAQIKSPLFLDGEVTDVTSVWIAPSIPAGAQNTVDYWFNTSTGILWQYDPVAGTWSINATNDRYRTMSLVGFGNVVYFKHGAISDDARVFHRTSVSGSVTDFITEEFTPGTGSKQYVRTNAETIRINAADATGIIDVYAINPSNNRVSPAKLVDTRASTVITNLPVWHPAAGRHSPVAIHNIDLQHSTDPARYSVTLNSDPSIAWHVDNPWNQAEIGKSWMDMSYLGYVPYYDTEIFPTLNDRLFSWGKLAPWGDVRVYEWVQSTVPPSSWDDTVTAQINAPIAQSEKATGTPKMATFRRRRQRVAATISTINSTVSSVLTLEDYDSVLFNADVLPTGIEAGTKYTVVNATGTTFKVADPTSEEVIVFTDAGVNVTITPAFTAADWTKQTLEVDRINGPFLAANVRQLAGVATPVNWTNGYTLPIAEVAWTPKNLSAWTIDVAPYGDTVDVYVNGKLRDSACPVTYNSGAGMLVAQVAAPFVVQQYDTIDLVRPERLPTADDLAFNPDVEDDGTILIQWIREYEYTTRTVTLDQASANQTPTTYYYFWVEGMTARRPGDAGLSVEEASQQIATIPTAHMVLQQPLDDVDHSYPDPYNITSDARYSTPIMYRDSIVRRISNYLTDDNRFVVQFTRNLALRDQITANGRQMNLKNRHEEWFMFRREQPGAISRDLWDRLTESMCGYKLNDPTIRVPSSTRELYDARNGTDTRYGLGVDQAFVEKTLAIPTVLAYLQDPTKDFTPTDINEFFNQYSFDTPANIVIAMDAIYNSFAATHVNGIWFETLQDALSTKMQYAELLKTSWVALHGIRVLEVGGLFD